MKCIKFEFDNKSSLAFSITPALEYEPNDVNVDGHVYVVTDYNQKHKSVKLYDQTCEPELCVSSQTLPSSFTKNVDANKGELWVTMDQLKKRELEISSLHSKDRYQSVLQTKRIINTSFFDKNCCLYLDVCKAVVKKKSKFMINFLSYSHKVDIVKLFVTTYDDRRYVELNYKLPDRAYFRPPGYIYRKEEVKTQYFQSFNLQPNAYIFSLKIMLSKDDLENDNVKFLTKIASVSECTMEELKFED